MTRKWMGKKPVGCDICGHRFNDKDKHFYDFATRQGKWALGCSGCWRKHGRGLGNGVGQKYDLKTLEKVDPGYAKPVKSLAELRMLAKTDDRYVTVINVASSNLGGPKDDLDKCYSWLVTNANKVSDAAVVDEVNDCIDLYWPTP